MLKRSAPAWVWIGTAMLALLAALAWVSYPRELPGTQRLGEAKVTWLGSGSAAKRVALPHVWDDERPAWSGEAIYQLRVRADTLKVVRDEPMGLYLPRLGARFQVLVNDELVASEAWEASGYADTSVQPWFVVIPPGVRASTGGELRIDVRVRGQLLRKSGLGEVWIGPKEVLQRRWSLVHGWQVQGNWMVAACAAVVGLYAALMWLGARERMFAWLAAAFIALCIRTGLTPMVESGLPFSLWFWLHKLSFSWYCAFSCLFVLELFGVGLPRFKRAILVLAGLAPIWLALVAFTERYALYRLWMALVLAASVLTVVAMLWRARQGMDSAQRVSLIVSAAILVAGLRDFAVVQLGWRGDGDLRWMIWFSLAFMLTAAWILVDRSQRMVAAQIQLAKDLELRVGERESELRQAFERLRDAEREQVLTNERARITRDMHDGLGSQLVQALNLARAGEAGPERLVDMLQHALEELRTTLDALQPMEGDLPAILGTLRQRIAPALDAAGIQLDWAVLEVPAIRIDESVSESTAMMHLFKLLQEVFANILKHAGASRVRVRTYVRDSGDASTTAPGRRVVLEVMDNGAGLGSWATPGENRAGRGLANMRMRAAAVGAHVSWKPARPGTMVEISFLVRG